MPHDASAAGLRAGAARLTRDDWALLAVAVIWGASFAVIKDAYRHIPAVTFLTARFLLVALSVAPVLWWRRRHLAPARPAWRGAVLVGLLGVAGYQVLFALGLARTGAAQSTLLTSTSPLITGLLAAAFGLGRPTPWQWGGMVVALGGIALLTGGPGGDPASPWAAARAGELLTLGAAAAAASAFVLTERYLKDADLVSSMSLALFAGSLAVVAGGWPALAAVDWAHLPAAAWLELAYAAWVAGTGGYLLWYGALTRAGAVRGSLYGFLIPVVGVLAAVLGLGERLEALQWLGAGLVLAGVAGARFGPALAGRRYRPVQALPGK